MTSTWTRVQINEKNKKGVGLVSPRPLAYVLHSTLLWDLLQPQVDLVSPCCQTSSSSPLFICPLFSILLATTQQHLILPLALDLVHFPFFKAGTHAVYAGPFVYTHTYAHRLNEKIFFSCLYGFTGLCLCICFTYPCPH